MPYGFCTPKAITQQQLNAKLHKACSKGDALKVMDLLTKGADVNSITEGGASPLYLAIKSGHSKKQNIPELLIAYGAEIKAPKGEEINVPLTKGYLKIHNQLINSSLLKQPTQESWLQRMIDSDSQHTSSEHSR